MEQRPDRLISVGLSQNEVKLAAGGETPVLAVAIQNHSDVVERFVIEVEGLDPLWYTLSSQTASLFPGDATQVSLTLHPVWKGILPGRTPFEVRVSTSSRNAFNSAQGVLEIEGEAKLGISLSPQRVTGRKGQYGVTLTNEGSKATQMELDGTDAELGLNYKFGNREPDVPAYGSVVVPLTVKPKRFHFVGFETRYGFEVNASPIDVASGSQKSEATQSVRGELVHTAILKSWRWPVIAALLLVGLIAFLIIRPEFPGAQPSVTFFVANPSMIPSGEKVTLRWETANAVKATIAETNQEVPVNAQGQGQLEDSPRLSRTYTLCVSNAKGEQKCSAPLLITVLPEGATVPDTPVAGSGEPAGATAPTGRTPAAGRRSPTAGGGSNSGAGTGTGGTGTGTGAGTGNGGNTTGSGGRGTPTATQRPAGGATPPRIATTATAVGAAPGAPTATVISPSTPPPIGAQCDPAGSQDGAADPASAGPGGTITLTASGFTPGEQIFFSLTDPNGVLQGTSDPISGAIKDDGSLDIEPLTITEEFTRAPGRWIANFLGVNSGHRSVIFFCVTQ